MLSQMLMLAERLVMWADREMGYPYIEWALTVITNRVVLANLTTTNMVT